MHKKQNVVHKICCLCYNNDIMKEVSRQNSIQNDIFLFRERVNALIESKYIIAEQKISSLLKGIVSISFLTDTVAQ